MLGTFYPSVGLQTKTSCDALYCDFLPRIEGIALQGSFLHTLESFPESRDTNKGFAFVILFCMDHAIMFKGTRSSSSAIMTSCHRLARAHREHTTATHPVRHDGANPTQAGGRYALDREIPLLAFVGRIPRTGFAGCCGRPS